VAAGLGVAPGRIRVIPNGVDAERFSPRDRGEARRALGLPEDRPILLSVGGLNPGKGHHRVVELLPALLRSHPDLLYVVVGGERPGDSSRPLIERLVRERGLQRHVLLAGERPHGEVPLWNAAADLCCLATRSEGWANVLLEALACGLPVVSTRVGGNAEIVSHEGLGLLVPPEDDGALAQAILEALGRRWDREAIVAHARLHSWEAAAAAVLEEWQAAVGAARGAGAPGPALATVPDGDAGRPRATDGGRP
jgi:glycosyltransferase involved in cell wall biosynthesis